MRHREGAPNAAAFEATIEARAAAARKKARGVGMSDSAFLARLDELGSMLKGVDGQTIASARGIHFVALYADLHYRVYGIVPADLARKERVYAASMAERALEKDFGGDRSKMADFISWAWSRESGREAWRRENKKSGGRITWRSQFDRKLLTEYRLEEARKAAR